MITAVKKRLQGSVVRALTLAFFGLVLGFVLTPLLYTPVKAEDTCEGGSGNLDGYIDTDYGPVYLSQESWNDDHPSKPIDDSFYVSYDVEQGIWSGKGFNEEVGPVDFNYDQENHLVRFERPGREYDRLHDSDQNNDEPVEWGNWKGVADLSLVSYNVQNGEFLGEGYDVDPHTGEGDVDEPVGSGVWRFDNVVMKQPACPESINILINQRTNYHKNTCPIDKNKVIIQWTSEGVEDCRSVAGYWELRDRPAQNTGTNVHPYRDIDEHDGRVRFTMRCKGKYSGMDIERSAVASCGESNVDNNNNGSGGNQEEQGIIAPKIIEA